MIFREKSMAMTNLMLDVRGQETAAPARTVNMFDIESRRVFDMEDLESRDENLASTTEYMINIQEQDPGLCGIH